MKQQCLLSLHQFCPRHQDDGHPRLPAECSPEPSNHRRTDVMVTALLMVATVAGSRCCDPGAVTIISASWETAMSFTWSQVRAWRRSSSAHYFLWVISTWFLWVSCVGFWTHWKAETFSEFPWNEFLYDIFIESIFSIGWVKIINS